MSTPGGIVAWAASDGRRPKMVDGVRKALDKEAGKNSTPGHKRNENKDTSTKSDNKGGNGKQNDEGNQKDCGGGATANGDNNQQSNDSSGWTEEQDSELIAFRKEHPKGQWTCAEKMGKTTGECGKRFGERQWRN